MISALLSLCLAHTTFVSPLDPRLNGEGGWTTRDGQIFISETFKDDARLRAHECGHYVDFVLLKGSKPTFDRDFSRGMNQTRSDDPSLDFYRLDWANYETPKPGATFPTAYASTLAIEDFAESFAALATHEPLDGQRTEAMTKLLSTPTLHTQSLPAPPDYARPDLFRTR